MGIAMLRMLILQTQASAGRNMDVNSVAEYMDHSFLLQMSETASLQRLPSEIS